MARDVQAVTGAFGYSGRHVAELLLARGARVRTLTGHPDRPDPFGGRVEVAPLAFDDPAALRRALEGVVNRFLKDPESSRNALAFIAGAPFGRKKKDKA